MENKYCELLNNLRKLRNDELFNPNELDKLNAEERRKIEYEILSNILSGNINFYKYIPYLRNYNPSEISERIDINLLPIDNVINFDLQIYKATRNINDLKRIVSLAKSNVLAFQCLIDLYFDNQKNNQEDINVELLNQIRRCITSDNIKEYQKIMTIAVR